MHKWINTALALSAIGLAYLWAHKESAETTSTQDLIAVLCHDGPIDLLSQDTYAQLATRRQCEDLTAASAR